MIKCPICKKDDSAQKIGVILDNGKSESNTFGINIPLNTKKHSAPVSISTFTTSTQSRLIDRLEPEAKPFQQWKHFTIITYLFYLMPLMNLIDIGNALSEFEIIINTLIVFFPFVISRLIKKFKSKLSHIKIKKRFKILIYLSYYFVLIRWALSSLSITVVDNLVRTPYGIFDLKEYFGLLIVASILSLPIFILVSFLRELWVPPNKKVETWKKALRDYRTSYYCFRDDLCFNDKFHEEPEEYITKIFNQVN